MKKAAAHVIIGCSKNERNRQYLKFQYRPRGVCSQLMDIEVEDGRIVNVNVTGGCPGNLQGISRLLKGMSVDDAIERMDGIRCGMKRSSCPDQLAQALKQMRDGAQS